MSFASDQDRRATKSDRALGDRVRAITSRGSRTVLIASDGLPRLPTRQGLPPGHVLIHAARPETAIVFPIDGRPRRTGGTGGVTARGRDRRTGYDAYERTDLASWQLDLVLEDGGRSVEQQVQRLMAVCSPLSANSVLGPPVLAIHGPAPLPSGLYRCGDLVDGECEYLGDGLRRSAYEGTLTLIPFVRGASDAVGLDAATTKAKLKAQEQRAKAKKPSAAALADARSRLPGKRR